MGTLAAARHDLQTVVRQEDGEEPNPEIILKYLTEFVVLLGQAINKIAYERRLIVQAALSNVKNVKRQLKDNQKDINKEKRFLFGEVKMIVAAVTSTTVLKSYYWPSLCTC